MADDQTAQDGPLDLGWLAIGLGVGNMQNSLAFYEKLGMRVCGGKPEQGWAVLRNGATELGLFTFFPGPLIGFRGGDVIGLGRILRERGFAPTNEATFDPAQYPAEWSQAADGSPLPLDGCASFMLSDVDGTPIMFDTVPAERAQLLAGAASMYPADPQAAAGELRLGKFTYCINVASIEAAIEFYTRLGLELLEDRRTDRWAVVGSSARNYSLSLFQGHIDSNLLNFRGGNVFELAAEFERRGLELASPAKTEADGSDSCELIDPDGFKVYFNTHRSERLY